MATKPMKTPGTPGGSMTKRSPLAPVEGQVKGTGMRVDDASAKIVKGVLRSRGPAVGGTDSALGVKGNRSRTATTANSAQHRVTAALPGPSLPEARATQANGRIVPAVMGSKQRRNFDMQTGVLY